MQVEIHDESHPANVVKMARCSSRKNMEEDVRDEQTKKRPTHTVFLEKASLYVDIEEIL